MKATAHPSTDSAQARIERLHWPSRDAEVVRIFIGATPARHEVFHVAVSGSAIQTLKNHDIEFDIVAAVRRYLARAGVLDALLAASEEWRRGNPDHFYEKCFGWRDLGQPIRAEWM